MKNNPIHPNHTLAWGACVLLLTGMTAARAQAQAPGVYITGGIDLNVRSVTNGGQTARFMGSDGLAPSRLGFRGTEDLGGGMRAHFWIENGFSADTGAQLSPTKFFNRRSWVSLSSSLGEVRLGRDYSPTWMTHVLYDAFSGLGLGGSVNLLAPSIAFNYLGSGTQTAQRADNAVSYFLPPNLGGFSGQLMVSAPEGNPANKLSAARLGYKVGALDVTLAYSKGYTQPASVQVLNGGIIYDIGFARLMGVLSDMKSGARKQSNVVVGTVVPVGAAGELKASFGASNASGAGTDANDARQLAVGYVYNLSKRTALYSTYARITNRGNANFTVAPLPTDPLPPPPVGLPINAGRPSHGVDVGIRHTF